MSARKAWRGVAWPPLKDGVCTRHNDASAMSLGICMTCHHEQLAAAQRGSSEFERKSA